MTKSNISRRLTTVDPNGNLIRLRQNDILYRKEPIIVLGDAGIGKTTLLEEIGLQDGYSYVHARRLVRSHDPTKLLGDANTFVIDALDELSTQVEGSAVDAVLTALEQAGSPNFILACRVADWRSATAIQSLSDSYGSNPMEFFLEPISREEAQDLLSQGIGNELAAEVIAHFERNKLEELFGNPQTLKLIRAVAGDGDLPTSKSALFELSIKRLWAEHSQKKVGSSLSRLNEDQALNAAGAAFAALLLAGKRALSRLPTFDIDEDDLPIAEISAFTPKEDLEAVLQSRLLSSNVEGSADRFSYTHRSIGEFLAARWLARQANTDRKRRRLLRLFQQQGLVPSSLRGVHAWLARDPCFALEIIAVDPMGVVEYGDTNDLTDEQARKLLNSLFELGDRDQRYYDFDKAHSLRGIAKTSLCSEIKDLIVSRSTPFSLRAMLLHSVSGSPVATMLAKTLEEMVIDPDVSFYERRIAADALTNLPENSVEWPRLLLELHYLADQSSLRLAIEILPGMGFVGPTDTQIVELILAFSGLSMCKFPRSEETRIGGVMWGLEKKLPDDRIEPILDILADYLSVLLGDSYDRFENSDAINVVYVLVERRLALGRVDPLRLWRWLSSLGERRGFRDDSQKAISQWLHDNDQERRRIQRLALLEEPGPKTVWMRSWRLNDQLNGLYPKEADVIELLGSLDPSTETSGDRWKDLVRLCPHDQEHGEIVREAAARFATEPEGRAFLDQFANPEVPDWQIKQEKRERQQKEKQQRSWAEHRANFLKHIDDLRAGKYAEVVNPAQAYLNLYSDMGNDVVAHQRIEQWLGLDLQQAAFQGFEVFLADKSSKPTADEIAESYAHSRRWTAAYIYVAGVAERVRNRKPLDDLSDDRLLATLLEIRFTHILDHANIDHVLEEVEKAVKSRSGLWEQFWRLRIEPQLEAQKEHIDGLHEIARGTNSSDLSVALSTEWLERFPEMSHRAEVELIDCLVAAGELEILITYAQKRRGSGFSDEERSSDWDAVAFLVDFENVRQHLEANRVKDPNFIWNLRSRLGQRRDEGTPAPLSAKQLSWIIGHFRTSWRNVPHPSGSTTGDVNLWDAAEFLVTQINRLANQTSTEAIEELSALCEAPTDSYTNHLKRGFAEQAQKVVEKRYVSPTMSELQAVLTDGPPNTVDELQAIMLEELAVIQRKVRSHPADWYRDFYADDVPKDEEACRDMLLKMFGDYPCNILCVPEGHLADDKRADIQCTFNKLMLPIEVKGQWHEDLWDAADKQLEKLYSNDWRADRRGIYLVFWFGQEVPTNKKLKSPGRGIDKPATAEELRLALNERSLAAKEGRVEIVVLDLVRT
jgi:hypothetical protein